MKKKFTVGAVIQFGGYDWRVLEIQNDKVLILSDKIIEERAYHGEYVDITWEQCDLREHLNSTFFNSFSAKDKVRIAETRIQNPNNQWYGTEGDSDTTDKIFLLSLEEVDKYFGDNGDYREKMRKDYEGYWPDGKWITVDDGCEFSNASDSDRIAKDNDGKASWWWLRSPGINYSAAADVGNVGYVNVNGSHVASAGGGIRAALWINF